MNRIALLLLAAAAAASAAATPLAAQSTGAIEGRVRDAESGSGVANALVTIDAGRRGATTDTSGTYRIREVRSGIYTVQVRAIGFQPATIDSVRVRSGETTRLDLAMRRVVVELAPVEVVADDPVLDPLATQTEQRVTARDLRSLPVSTVEEALALTAGSVGESYRGGRLGQQSFVIDGLGVKNQLDASSGSLGLRFPPDMLTEVALVTNGFSARYGQALSGLVNVVTKDGGDEWSGRTAYETDRPLTGGADRGLDRIVLQADGPIAGGVRALVALDASARLDADPVNAPRPEDPLDPRATGSPILPHNSGEQYNAAAKLTVPLGARQTVRLFGLRSVDQRLLYDPAFKYAPAFGPARKTVGMLLSGHAQHTSGPSARLPYVADLRVGYFVRDFLRGQLEETPEAEFGAFTGRKFRFSGEGLARAQDVAGASNVVPGFFEPTFATNTPYGVPAFFLSGASRGEIAWNQFRELRSQLDVTMGLGGRSDLYFGGELVRQRVRTFQRALAYRPVGGEVPAPAAGNFEPAAAALYSEAQFRLGELGFTAGLRFDRFDARTDIPDASGALPKAQSKLNPRIAVSTALSGATVVASLGSFSQAPDYQFLVDAAFDDTTRTGRFRQGNPNLGFERSWQYELSVRGRPRPDLSVRVNAFLKRLEGLVASEPLGTNPDSSIFNNSDRGTVRGAEVLVERELRGGFGFRANYTLQEALATSTNAFLLRRAIIVDPMTHDTTYPPKVEFPLDYDRRHNVTLLLQSQVPQGKGFRVFGLNPIAGLEAAAIGRYSSGLPYTALGGSGGSVGNQADTVGLPNGSRLPAVSTLDLLVRRPFELGGVRASVYIDARNVLNRRNIISVRRDTRAPEPDDVILATMAQQAYLAHPEPIPYESSRYRDYADTDRNGYIEGSGELLPLYLAAARDFTQPIFAFGPPRLLRFGMEMLF